MLMCLMQIPLDEVEVTPRKKPKTPLVNESTYWINKAVELKDLKCPTCQDSACLFKGVVYIGCRSCMNYFPEDDIINANGGLI